MKYYEFYFYLIIHIKLICDRVFLLVVIAIVQIIIANALHTDHFNKSGNSYLIEGMLNRFSPTLLKLLTLGSEIYIDLLNLFRYNTEHLFVEKCRFIFKSCR